MEAIYENDSLIYCVRILRILGRHGTSRAAHVRTAYRLATGSIVPAQQPWINPRYDLYANWVQLLLPDLVVD